MARSQDVHKFHQKEHRERNVEVKSCPPNYMLLNLGEGSECSELFFQVSVSFSYSKLKAGGKGNTKVNKGQV